MARLNKLDPKINFFDTNENKVITTHAFHEEEEEEETKLKKLVFYKILTKKQLG